MIILTFHLKKNSILRLTKQYCEIKTINFINFLRFAAYHIDSKLRTRATTKIFKPKKVEFQIKAESAYAKYGLEDIDRK